MRLQALHKRTVVHRTAPNRRPKNRRHSFFRILYNSALQLYTTDYHGTSVYHFKPTTMLYSTTTAYQEELYQQKPE